MEQIKKAHSHNAQRVYQMDSHQFIVHREFKNAQTIQQIIIAEITNGILQKKATSEPDDYDIISP